MPVYEKGWIFDEDDENDNDDGEKSNGKPCAQLFWASILISGGGVCYHQGLPYLVFTSLKSWGTILSFSSIYVPKATPALY